VDAAIACVRAFDGTLATLATGIWREQAGVEIGEQVMIKLKHRHPLGTTTHATGPEPRA